MRWRERLQAILGRRGGPATEVVLYTRRDCCLCEEARKVLEGYRPRYRLEIREVDIDADPELVRLYDDCVPVVSIGGVVRFRGRVNEILLRRLFGG